MKAELISLPDLIQSFSPDPVISLAGAGGKTTLMFRIAAMLDRKCVVTTTTKIGVGQNLAADISITCGEIASVREGKTIWVSPSLDPVNGKIIGCGVEAFHKLAAYCRKNKIPVINEADGSAEKHIKAPAEHEPAIPAETNVCFYLAGLDVLGKPVNSGLVHRERLFSEITGALPGEEIKPEHIVRLFDHHSGGLKNMPESSLKIAHLTHVNTPERILAGHYIAENLQNYDLICLHE